MLIPHLTHLSWINPHTHMHTAHVNIISINIMYTYPCLCYIHSHFSSGFAKNRDRQNKGESMSNIWQAGGREWERGRLKESELEVEDETQKVVFLPQWSQHGKGNSISLNSISTQYAQQALLELITHQFISLGKCEAWRNEDEAFTVLPRWQIQHFSRETPSDKIGRKRKCKVGEEFPVTNHFTAPSQFDDISTSTQALEDKDDWFDPGTTTTAVVVINWLRFTL